jgi:hypothetical protein
VQANFGEQRLEIGPQQNAIAGRRWCQLKR